ncbi:hypothetical protein EHS13_12515 [Paenibacillus psychroresistens]|uniref:Uncharacterized protein n=1 Tax=Paenibacillus psychroresistens TaxID=1778678 RepID=A0A6B8RJY0_9BACL|nr:hypothetical protein [Paenibacillus psychroresistens]QGQ95648.1 hypothetical protein EHS13_12515 [Paenibacillus psychroresistens]
MNTHYKFSSEVVKTQLQKNMPKIITIVILAGCLGIYLGVKGSGLDKSIFISAPLVFISIGIGMRRGLQKRSLILSSYELMIYDDVIIQRQMGSADRNIKRSEITMIVEYKNKGIKIKTNDNKRTIFIPLKLTGYQEVKETLQAWNQIKQG